ncbi:MAG: glutamate racemase [Bacillota bacterium]
MAKGTVGLFDSGVGGLTVVREVSVILPGKRVIYFGDTAHVPYGDKSVDELLSYAERIIGFLCSQGADYIIFACNTSSAVSLRLMRDRFQVPMIGLIEPGAAEAVRLSAAGRIGLIATEATVKAGAYARAVSALNRNCQVFSQAAPRLVPLVESGESDTPKAEQAVREYLEPLREQGIDTLILGCTHYPFLRDVIERVLGPEVVLVDPAAATVRAARLDMLRRGLFADNPGAQGERDTVSLRYFVSGNADAFRAVAGQFLGREPAPVTEICLLR